MVVTIEVSKKKKKKNQSTGLDWEEDQVDVVGLLIFKGV